MPKLTFSTFSGSRKQSGSTTNVELFSMIKGLSLHILACFISGSKRILIIRSAEYFSGGVQKWDIVAYRETTLAMSMCIIHKVTSYTRKSVNLYTDM